MKILQNIESIREDFPILREKIYGKDLIYLDNAATTQKPKSVIDTICDYYSKYNANVHRGIYYLSNFCTEAMEQTRTLISSFINAKSIEEIIFTRGTTESINLISYSYGEDFIFEGDEILITEMEHHSNIVPWQLLCERKSANLKIIPITDDGNLNIDEFKKLLSEKTKILSLTAISNVLGTINPIKEIIKIIKNYNPKIITIVDAAQLAAHEKIDVQDLNCDFLVFSAHKVYAPTGVGVLFGKKEILEKMRPFLSGGEMIKKVRFEKTTFNVIPYKFEAGTPNYIDIIAFSKAIEYVNKISLDEINYYEKELLNYALDKLLEIEGIKIIGKSKNKSAVISFIINNIHPSDIGTLLDKMGIAIRTGTHCAEPLLHRYNISSTARISFAFYNTIEEVDKFIIALNKLIKVLS